KSLFENNDVDFQQETTLRREIAIDGKSRAFVNDTPVNLATLKLIGENLIAIHSQHATLEISNADFQLLILDVLANHQSLLKSYKEGFRQLRQTEKQLALLTEQTEEAKKKQDYEQFLFNELEEAALKEDEQEHLEQELEKLTHAESIKRSLIASANLISESETAAINLVKEAGLQLNSIEKFDPAIAEINERLKSTLIELRDIASEISEIEENTEHNAARMETIQERLDLFYALQQKHRVGSNAELLAIQEQLSQNLNALLNSDEQLEKLQQEIDALNKDLRQQAKELDGNRRKAMVIAEKEVGAALKQMNMPNASISFNLTEQAQLNNNVDLLTVDSHVTIVRPKSNFSPEYLGLTIHSLEDHWESMALGSTGQTELSRKSIAEVAIKIPTKELLDKFSQMVSPVNQQIDNLLKQNIQLRQIRDRLLPRLISGKLQLKAFTS
ncbi:MAG: DNA repair protein RecN, partial [Flavobacterium psychrophilum]